MNPEVFRACVHDYWETENLTKFMEKCSPWILQYCAKRLRKDPDVVGDFYVHFYERAPRCLDKYKSRQHIPFPAYLATYLRHEFNNFIRGKERSGFSEYASGDLSERSAVTETSSSLSADHLIRNLPASLRLPIKLYYGLMLDTGDLRIIASRYDDPNEAVFFLTEIQARKEKILDKMSRLQDRAARLNYLIHTAGTRKNENETVWRRWKQRTELFLNRDQAVCTVGELATLFGVNKSTISRRLERGIKMLKGAANENRNESLSSGR
ncbi:MAG TPA: sigma-70 family RNA polymerase sigma factor [Leptospiraceae bacterium]|nr:sigma-70 family RNA polymerase sigma factor [Leptospiraceae bacterium]